MFNFSWRDNKYTLSMIPDEPFFYSTMAEIKRRNGKYCIYIKKTPIELTEKYHSYVKLENPKQKHFQSLNEAKSFIESYFKTFNIKDQANASHGSR